MLVSLSVDDALPRIAIIGLACDDPAHWKALCLSIRAGGCGKGNASCQRICIDANSFWLDVQSYLEPYGDDRGPRYIDVQFWRA